MKYIFFILLACCTYTSHVLAQAKGSSASGGSSSAGSSQTGYVYYLKYYKHGAHIHYASLVTETYAFTRKDLNGKMFSEIFGEKIKRRKLITSNCILDRRINKYLSKGLHSFKEYNIRSFDVQASEIQQRHNKYADADDDTLLVVTVMYFDSIPRYWYRPRHGISTLFTRARLRLSLSQDTTMLSAKLYYPSFSDDIIQDPDSIFNPNYVFRSSNLSSIVPQPNLEKLYADIKLQPGKTLYEWKLDAYADLVKEYKKKIYQGTRIRHDLKGSITKEAGQQYANAKALYDSIIDEYNDKVRDRNEILDSLKAKLSDPEDQKNLVDNQLNFLQALYELSKIKQPAPPPVDKVDSLISEVAIPINRNDSANNFYYQIIHKNTLNQPMYFISRHYGTWDYGALTIPFRYRFPQHGTKIIVATGMVPDTISVPGESDAALSVGMYVGRKWGHTRFYENAGMTANTFSFEPVFFLGPTLIPMSSFNVADDSKYIAVNTYVGPTNIIAASTGIGIVLQWKAINFGFFGGVDLPLTCNTGWVYADKPWLGFGIGVNLGILSSGNSVE